VRPRFVMGACRPSSRLAALNPGCAARKRYSCAMATIQVREVPEDAYEVIRKRARAEGRSIQSYMRDLVVEFAAHPTAREVLVTLEAALAGHGTPGATRESVQADLAGDRR